MRDFLHILIGAFGAIAFVASVIYAVGAIRTKDKNAGYISIAMMLVCIISLLYLAF